MSTLVATDAALAAYRSATGMEPAEAAGLVGITRPKGMVVQMESGELRSALVGVYRAAEAGIEDDPDAGGWATVCERHSSCIVHTTRALAFSHSRQPDGWCEPCRDGICQTCLSPERERTGPAYYRQHGTDCPDPYHTT